MKNASKEVSDSDDSDLIVDPSPVFSLENTLLDKSIVEKYLFDSGKNSHKENEAESTDSNNDDSGRIQKNSENKMVEKKKKSSMEVQVAAKKNRLKNGTSHVEATFNAEDLSSDDEVFLFHCPENFKKHDLLNRKINISKPKQFVHAEDGEKYQLTILNSENKQQVTLAIPEKSSVGRLINLPLRGHILIQKILHMESDSINDLVETEQTVIFPTDIKIRHPFLGVDWKAYINSAMVAIEKNKKMRKKIKRERTECGTDVENKKFKRKKFL